MGCGGKDNSTAQPWMYTGQEERTPARRMPYGSIARVAASVTRRACILRARMRFSLLEAIG